MSAVNWKGILVEDGNLSLGRVLSVVTFGVLCYFWFTGTKVPESILTVFYTTLGYNASKKVTTPVRSYLDGKLEAVRTKPHNPKEGADVGGNQEG